MPARSRAVPGRRGAAAAHGATASEEAVEQLPEHGLLLPPATKSETRLDRRRQAAAATSAPPLRIARRVRSKAMEKAGTDRVKGVRRAAEEQRSAARRERLRADRALTPAERLDRGIALSRFAVELREAASRSRR